MRHGYKYRHKGCEGNPKRKLSTSSSLNLPALHILSKSSPPAAYSITMAK